MTVYIVAIYAIIAFTAIETTFGAAKQYVFKFSVLTFEVNNLLFFLSKLTFLLIDFSFKPVLVFFMYFTVVF